MKEILKKGESSFVTKCDVCGCKFRYNLFDIHITGTTVSCPRCGHYCAHKLENAVRGKENEEVNRDSVKHGYWMGEYSKERLSIDEDGRVETRFECAVCSECGEDLLASEEYFVRGRYCPACGARMDGKENEDV